MESREEKNTEESETSVSDRITLTVYFSGMGHAIADLRMLGGVLYAATLEDEQHLKMGFNGCRIDYGLPGALFGAGLKTQCKTVVKKVIALLKAGKRVRLIVYGHSRGAVAGLLLAKMLGNFDRDKVEVNLALMDPVPGNFIFTSKMDVTSFSLAKQAMDVSRCRNLNKVLVIYPREPLWSIVLHAPLIPQYPASCQVTEEIIPGCHSRAQFMHRGHKGFVGGNDGSTITFLLMTRFLMELGTKLDLSSFHPDLSKTEKADQKLLEAYQNAFRQLLAVNTLRNTSRTCHAKDSINIETNWPANYLTPMHEELAKQYQEKTNTSEKDRKYAYYFSAERNLKSQQKKTTVECDLQEKTNLFIQFLTDVYTDGMSSKSQNSEKGLLIKQYIEALNQSSDLINDQTFNDVLRNALAIFLQRDRNQYSLCSTTNSGVYAVRLLNRDKYQVFAEIILGNSESKLRYRDLRNFVLGENKKEYFNAENSQSMYRFFLSENAEVDKDEESRFFANNLPSYLP